MDCSSPALPVHHQFPEFTQTHVRWVNNVIQPSYPLLSPFLPPSVLLSIRVFSNESVLPIRWPKCWSFSISPSNEHSGLISFRMDWLDLLAVQGTLKSLLQPHSSKSINSLVLSFLYIQHPLDHWKSKRVPDKQLLLFYWLCQSLWLCGPQQTVENSERDGNTRPHDLPLEKSVYRSRSNS